MNTYQRLFGLIVLLGATAGAAIGRGALEASVGPAVLNFPGQSLGTITFMPPEGRSSFMFIGPHQRMSQAVGEVHLPKGQMCYLTVSYDAAVDPSVFAKCLPNQIAVLNFDKLPITNAGLKNIEHLTGLVGLELRDTDIGDAGLEHIAKVRSLECLDLDSTNITAVGVASLKPLNNMLTLSLARNPIGGSCLTVMRSFPRLRILDIKQMRLTDKSLLSLIGMNNLEDLDVSNNRDITASGLSQLASLRKLRGLHIEGTDVQPQDASVFRNFPHLELLYIGGSSFVDADGPKWHKVLPQVKVAVLHDRNSKIPMELFNPHNGNYKLPGHSASGF